MANKPNEGALFINKERTTDSQPNAKGSATIGGIEYWVSAWTNNAQQTGERYQKLKFTEKERQQPITRSDVPMQGRTPAAPAGDFQDDIPF